MTTPGLTDVCASLSAALRQVLDAALDTDRHAACEALRGSVERQGSCARAREHERVENLTRSRPRVDDLQLIDCLCRVNSLLDQLAQHVSTVGDRAALAPEQRMELIALRDSGTCRLHHLGNAPLNSPSLDPDYRRCGVSLRELSYRWTLDRSRTHKLCSAIASALLQASSHATRAAPDGPCRSGVRL